MIILKLNTCYTNKKKLMKKYSHNNKYLLCIIYVHTSRYDMKYRKLYIIIFCIKRWSVNLTEQNRIPNSIFNDFFTWKWGLMCFECGMRWVLSPAQSRFFFVDLKFLVRFTTTTIAINLVDTVFFFWIRSWSRQKVT